MSENATTIPPKGLGSIKWNDLLKGVYYASIGQFLALGGFLISGILTDHPHFPTWVEWLPYVKATVYAIGGYIAGKFGVNNVGQIFTKDKPVVHVDAAELDSLKQQAEANKQ
ncbi:MAG: hypothetical protein ABI091_26850 [Ferruginibacter sp.]